jgi:hypothetical protein
MAWYADLTPCDYFRVADPSTLLAVGWLERSHAYDVGDCDRAVYEKLSRLLVDPWQPMVFGGPHHCDLCRFSSEASGARNLFVPGNSILYVCPELIAHYVNAHGYCPPAQFCEAVLACPDTRSREYKVAFLANGGRQFMGQSKSE